MMSASEQKRFAEKLRKDFGQGVLVDTPFPEPYCEEKSKVKAIYLGCDPSNKHCRKLEYVFALPNGDPPVFRRMIATIGANLRQVGLSWDNVFVQNLCRNYFELETAKNTPLWNQVAAIWIPILREELSQFKPDIPVLLSAEVIYRILLNEGVKPKNAVEFYTCRQTATIPIPADASQLGRPLIPFYRHWYYDLNKKEWSRYKAAVASSVH